MVQKIHPWCVIWVPNFGPHAGNLSDTKMTSKLSSMKMSVLSMKKRDFFKYVIHIILKSGNL